MDHFNYNGRICKDDMPVIGAHNRGLRFGDGVFETIRSRNNELQLAEDHFERLWKGMNALQFNIPVHFTAETLQEEITKLLNKNGHRGLARVRLSVFRGDGGLYDEIDHTPNYLIQTWKLPEDTGQWNSNGLVLGIYTDAKKNCDLLSGLKHNNFLPYVMAAMHAKRQRWNDALLLNSHGRICDSTMANIFLIKDGTIYTPSTGEGCIEGVMRKNILRHLSGTGWRIIEAAMTPDDLADADEAFLTNSIHRIRWIQAIAGKKYGNRFTKKIYDSLPATIS